MDSKLQVDLSFSHFSHVGQRDQNQDRCAVFQAVETGGWLFVVADGLGGHSGGELAAETVVAAAGSCWEGREASEDLHVSLHRLVAECHSAVCMAGRETGLDPHSTLAALAFEGNRAVSVHVGDSRVVQLAHGGGVAKRTVDQSVAQLLVLEGKITEEEMATHSGQNIVFSQIGGSDAPDPKVTEWDLVEGNRFILCSDGFWEIFSEQEMSEISREADPVAESVQRLGSKLENREDHDNVTAIFAEVQGISGRGVPLWGFVTRPKTWVWLTLGGSALALAGVLLSGRDPEPTPFAEEAKPAARAAVTAALAGGETRVSDSSTAPWRGAGPASVDALVGETSPTEQGGRSAAVLAEGATEEVAGGDGTVEECAEAEPCVGRPGKPVALEPVLVKGPVSVAEAKTVVDATDDYLRERGHLGVKDELVPKGSPATVEGSVFTRAVQVHNGIPVYAAEVVMRSVEDQVVMIQGDLGTDIVLPTGLAERSYPVVLDLAQRLLGEKIEAQGDGTRVVFPVPGGHRLAWAGGVTIGAGPLEEAVFDAATGVVLFRVPTAPNVEDDGDR